MTRQRDGLQAGRSPAAVLIAAAAGSLAVLFGMAIGLQPILALLLAAVFAVPAMLTAAFWVAWRIAKGNRRVAVDLFLFWLLAINLPAYFAFDTSGLSRTDLLNPQSIGRIVLTFIIGLAFFANRLGKQRIRKTGLPTIRLAFLPLLLLGWYALSSLLTVSRGVDFLLIAFRIAEWLLLILVVVSLAQDSDRDQPGSFTEQPLRFAWPIVIFVVAITFVILPVSPHSIYLMGQSGTGRLGNPFAHPNVLSILAGMGIYYVVEMRLRYRWWYVAIFLGVLIAAYSRGAWLGFLLATSVYAVMRARQGIPRVLTMLTAMLAASLAYVGQDYVWQTVSQLATRSSKHEDLTTASERTAVWRAAGILIRESPLVGHGYIIGPKKINEVMATGTSAQYFRANHAHNEFVQAMIGAGIPAALLTLALLARWLLLMVRLSHKGGDPFVRCSTMWTIQILTYGMLTPLLSMHVMIPGALLLYLYIAAEWKYRFNPIMVAAATPAARASAMPARSAT